MKYFTKWMICFLTLICAHLFFPYNVIARHGLITILAAATVLFLVNLVVKPLVQLVSLPFTVVTFGLFSFVINAAMVSLTGFLVFGFAVHGFLCCLLISLVISAANSIFVAKQKD